MPSAATDDQQERASIRITLAEHRSEPAERLRAAKDAGRFDVRGKPAQAASRSSAPISTAASASRLRAPRILSRVAA